MTSTMPARPHGPTKARRGELQGPPPNVPRQVRVITVRIEQLEDGRWKFTQPRIPGWGAAARNAGEVTAALRQGFVEAQVGGYSDWRGHVYDGSGPEYRRSRPAARSKRRCDVYDATAWRFAADGVWISPKGLRFPEGRQVVQRVMDARVAMGLPARPDPVSPDYVRPRRVKVTRDDWMGVLARHVEPAAREENTA